MREVYQVRNGQRVWPTCPSCGCRLEFLENGMFINLRHFGAIQEDARGHKCEYLEDEWTFIKGETSHFGYC
jgi:hypothetical protein